MSGDERVCVIAPPEAVTIRTLAAACKHRGTIQVYGWPAALYFNLGECVVLRPGDRVTLIQGNILMSRITAGQNDYWISSAATGCSCVYVKQGLKSPPPCRVPKDMCR